MAKIVVAVSLQGEGARRQPDPFVLPREDENWQTFYTLMLSMYKVPPSSIVIRYLDDEKDWVDMGSQAEFSEALRMTRSCGDILQVRVMPALDSDGWQLHSLINAAESQHSSKPNTADFYASVKQEVNPDPVGTGGYSPLNPPLQPLFYPQPNSNASVNSKTQLPVSPTAPVPYYPYPPNPMPQMVESAWLHYPQPTQSPVAPTPIGTNPSAPTDQEHFVNQLLSYPVADNSDKPYLQEKDAHIISNNNSNVGQCTNTSAVTTTTPQGAKSSNETSDGWDTAACLPLHEKISFLKKLVEKDESAGKDRSEKGNIGSDARNTDAPTHFPFTRPVIGLESAVACPLSKQSVNFREDKVDQLVPRGQDPFDATSQHVLDQVVLDSEKDTSPTLTPTKSYASNVINEKEKASEKSTRHLRRFAGLSNQVLEVSEPKIKSGIVQSPDPTTALVQGAIASLTSSSQRLCDPAHATEPCSGQEAVEAPRLPLPRGKRLSSSKQKVVNKGSTEAKSAIELDENTRVAREIGGSKSVKLNIENDKAKMSCIKIICASKTQPPVPFPRALHMMEGAPSGANAVAIEMPADNDQSEEVAASGGAASINASEETGEVLARDGDAASVAVQVNQCSGAHVSWITTQPPEPSVRRKPDCHDKKKKKPSEDKKHHKCCGDKEKRKLTAEEKEKKERKEKEKKKDDKEKRKEKEKRREEKEKRKAEKEQRRNAEAEERRRMKLSEDVESGEKVGVKGDAALQYNDFVKYMKRMKDDMKSSIVRNVTKHTDASVRNALLLASAHLDWKVPHKESENLSHHFGIYCDVCNSQIQGIRYKCGNCVDFDLCETCESYQVHDPTHVFLKLRKPARNAGCDKNGEGSGRYCLLKENVYEAEQSCSSTVDKSDQPNQQPASARPDSESSRDAEKVQIPVNDETEPVSKLITRAGSTGVWTKVHDVDNLSSSQIKVSDSSFDLTMARGIDSGMSKIGQEAEERLVAHDVAPLTLHSGCRPMHLSGDQERRNSGESSCSSSDSSSIVKVSSPGSWESTPSSPISKLEFVQKSLETESSPTISLTKATLPESTPMIPLTKATLPESTPMVPLTKATLPESTPMVPLTKATLPESTPMVSLIKATLPESTPLVPLTKATLPESTPMVPLIKATLPESTPLVPLTKATLSESTPMVPLTKATLPESTPMVPQTKATLPESTPMVPLTKATLLESTPMVPLTKAALPDIVVPMTRLTEATPTNPDTTSTSPQTDATMSATESHEEQKDADTLVNVDLVDVAKPEDSDRDFVDLEDASHTQDVIEADTADDDDDIDDSSSNSSYQEMWDSDTSDDFCIIDPDCTLLAPEAYEILPNGTSLAAALATSQNTQLKETEVNPRDLDTPEEVSCPAPNYAQVMSRQTVCGQDHEVTVVEEAKDVESEVNTENVAALEVEVERPEQENVVDSPLLLATVALINDDAPSLNDAPAAQCIGEGQESSAPEHVEKVLTKPEVNVATADGASYDEGVTDDAGEDEMRAAAVQIGSGLPCHMTDEEKNRLIEILRNEIGQEYILEARRAEADRRNRELDVEEAGDDMPRPLAVASPTISSVSRSTSVSSDQAVGEDLEKKESPSSLASSTRDADSQTVSPPPTPGQYLINNVSKAAANAFMTAKDVFLALQARQDAYRPPQSTYKPTEDRYQPPQDTYQPPQSTFKLPEDTYVPPQSSYKPAESTFKMPEDTYVPPQSSYKPPEDTYQPPKDTYTPAHSTYTPPKNTFKLPENKYEPPCNTYVPPKNTYKPPQSTYTPPVSSWTAPQSVFIPPNIEWIINGRKGKQSPVSTLKDDRVGGRCEDPQYMNVQDSEAHQASATGAGPCKRRNDLEEAGHGGNDPSLRQQEEDPSLITSVTSNVMSDGTPTIELDCVDVDDLSQTYVLCVADTPAQPQSTAVMATQEDEEMGRAMRHLAEMGFTNADLNQRLWARFNTDLDKVVVALIEGDH